MLFFEQLRGYLFIQSWYLTKKTFKQKWTHKKKMKDGILTQVFVVGCCIATIHANISWPTHCQAWWNRDCLKSDFILYTMYIIFHNFYWLEKSPFSRLGDLPCLGITQYSIYGQRISSVSLHIVLLSEWVSERLTESVSQRLRE